MILRKSILLMMVALVFWSCIEEDPNLVNAPPQSKTVRVRLINFADDKQDRKLVLDGKVETASVPFMSCSDAVQPPADSSNPSILKNGVEEYRSPRKIRFTKDNNYTVFAFPSMPIDTIPYKAVDTVIVVSTLSALPLREGYAYLRIINAVRDTNTTYQMRLGCPNGSMLGAVTYTKVSVQSEVSSENVAIVSSETSRISPVAGGLTTTSRWVSSARTLSLPANVMNSLPFKSSSQAFH